MNYPEDMCAPMRADLTSVGFVELRTPNDVIELLDKKDGTVLIMVNSVCGCAAGNARPAVKMTTSFENKVDTFATVFAGQDIGATAKAREYMLPFPPSSPSIAVFKDGSLVHFIERHHIEGRSAEIIADNLKDCFDQIYQ
jgi:putative YphP/YqiW family bacilliredoxin